jgi:acetylornithine deacetylase/succinyl-diaminopimelate desuccinylase-like protein
MAVQVYSMVALKRMGVRPRRDVVFTGVVEEEVGGAGASFWAENLAYDVALIVLGEPSRNHLSLGHRGIAQFWVKFSGKSVHASVPDSGRNPNLSMARFLIALEEQRHTLPAHELLGKTTVAPTIIEVDTRSMNVTPAWTRVLLDFRTASMSTNDIRSFVNQVAGELPFTLNHAWKDKADAPVVGSDETIFGYYTDPESADIQPIVEAISQGMGWRPELTSYQFATDGRFFVPLGATVIGYSPGEENLAHTVDESISLKMMADSLRGYVELIRTF